MIRTILHNEKGSVFPLIFGAIALVGLLTFAVFQLVSGPITGAMNLNNNTLTQSEMFLARQVTVATSVTQDNNGDCDLDGFVEPFPFIDSDGDDAPTNGGFIPSAMGVTMTDIWDTPFGYCVWDVGNSDMDGCGGADQDRLQGTTTPLAGNYGSQTVFALISAGPDKEFSTTCDDFTDVDTDVITTSGDDIVQRFSYAEASNASTDLWKASAANEGEIEIDRNIQVTGSARFSSIETTGKFIATNGVRLMDDTPATNSCSSSSDTGTIRYNGNTGRVQVCNGSSWGSLSGSGEEDKGTAESFISDTSETCSSLDHVGKVRYNSDDSILQYCSLSYQEYSSRGSEYVGWRNLPFRANPYGLILDQTELSFAITGETSPSGTYYSSEQVIIITNQSDSVTYTLTPSLDNTTHFEFTTPSTDPCGATLSNGDTCRIGIRAKDTDGNEFTGTFTLSDGVNPPYEVDLYGFGTEFCEAGEVGGGGIWAACNEGGYDYVMMPSCEDDTNIFEPTCDGDTVGEDEILFNNPYYNSYDGGTSATLGSGPGNTDLLVSQGFFRYPAAENCSGMIYNGYTDWFLPEIDLLEAIKSNADFDGADSLELDDGVNASSTVVSSGGPKVRVVEGGGAITSYDFIDTDYNDLDVTRRCVRRHPR